ncbi:glycosyltransferase [Spiribacter vilamensis]|uniref:Glycosyl transferase family 2 n=1 Tax=Spiribacter vilamensis TaxID=531306 RepID=A0A4Q8D148_9GAMM|nr:glycosyltransferase [Spiribacter vilamensis]RZU99101.1 glycosyl transferase family 2 [Spiribacter vilamensis]TVO61902.1 glycosyltransferase [Spiribacter vilamensis]
MTELKENNDRPLVTFALFAFNQEQYIREAVEGAFSQTYEPLEIILSDDCSTDRTFEIMQEMAEGYKGPHRVIALKNDPNLGIGPHVSSIVAQANGEYVAFAAGDDISKPDRVQYAMSILIPFSEKDGESRKYSFLSSLTLIDHSGDVFAHRSAPPTSSLSKKSSLPSNMRLFGLKDLLSGSLHTSGPSRVIPKDLHMVFGGVREDCFTEDIVYYFRSVLAGRVVFSSKSTVLYRKHDANVSAPEAFYARPFDGVAAQLRTDLKVAIDKGLLSSIEAKKAANWIDNKVAFRSFYRAKTNGSRPDFSDFISIIKSSHLSARRKFGILREYIGLR